MGVTPSSREMMTLRFESDPTEWEVTPSIPWIAVWMMRSFLAEIPVSLVEAASVDGATNLQTFWRIKWPQIMPTTLYILVITTINSFQCFALIQLLTSGGPNNSTQTIMYYIYYQAFKLNRYGYGSAMGIILAIIIALFSAIQFRLAKTDNG